MKYMNSWIWHLQSFEARPRVDFEWVLKDVSLKSVIYGNVVGRCFGTLMSQSLGVFSTLKFRSIMKGSQSCYNAGLIIRSIASTFGHVTRLCLRAVY